MKKITLYFLLTFFSFQSLSTTVSQSELEANLGLEKDYQSLSVAKDYAAYGTQVLLGDLEEMVDKLDAVKHSFSTQSFDDAIAHANDLINLANRYEENRARLQKEANNIFRSLFNRIQNDQSEPYENLNEVTGQRMYRFKRKVEDQIKAINFYKKVASVTRIQQGSFNNFDLGVEVFKEEEVQSRIRVLEDILSSL